MDGFLHRRRRVAALALAILMLTTAGCSIRRLAIDGLADSLAGTGDLFASEDDPELVRDAAPFALKSIEALLEEVPDHRELLVAACSGFTQYAYAFVETDALVAPSLTVERELEQRALRLYLRGRDYCLRALERSSPGIGRRLELDPAAAVATLGRESLDAMYWTGAAWGAAIAAGADRPELVADLPAVVALMERVLALDETYDDGAAHEALIALASTPANPDASEERARRHFQRAVELSAGRRAGPYITLALQVSVPRQDRAEFIRLLEQALAIDPDAYLPTRLANLVTQQRARHYMERADEWILALEPSGP